MAAIGRDAKWERGAGVGPGLRASADTGEAATGALAPEVAARTEAGRAFFEREADRLARCCHRMAERFARGGRLIALGATPAARSDARHVAVEFVHPVIVGKRALPALALTAEGGALADQLAAAAEPDDIVIAFGGGEARNLLASARERGCMTIGFDAGAGEWDFPPPGDEPAIRQELTETLYHLLWELVHVFFEHPGLLADACITCGDVAVEARVVAVDRQTATIEKDGAREQVAVELVAPVAVGDVLLCHAGVALERLA